MGAATRSTPPSTHPRGHRRGVGDLEGDPESGRDSAPDFYLVDHGDLCGAGELECRPSDVEDHDAFAGVAVYWWHCDRDGKYSLYSEGIEDQNYLRGAQMALLRCLIAGQAE